jgi:AcrR family transcriptional regulator
MLAGTVRSEGGAVKSSTTRAAYHHGTLADALVDAAVARVREHGTAQVTLRGLAQEIGVSPSAAYQHFPDKAALLRAVGDRAFQELEARTRAGVDAVPDDDDAGAVRRFAAVGYSYIGYAVDEPHLFRHMFSAAMVLPDDPCTFPSPPTPVGGSGDAVHDLMLACLAELSARGLLCGQDVPGLDVLAWSAVHGFASLIVEGHLPREAEDLLIRSIGLLVIRPEVLAEVFGPQA